MYGYNYLSESECQSKRRTSGSTSRKTEGMQLIQLVPQKVLASADCVQGLGG